MKELLASKLLDQLRIRHVEAEAALQLQLAQLEASGTVAPAILTQQKAAKLEALHAGQAREKQELEQRLALELGQLVKAQRELFAAAGLPGMDSGDAGAGGTDEAVSIQQKVLQTMLANMQLHRHQLKLQQIQSQMEKLASGQADNSEAESAEPARSTAPAEASPSAQAPRNNRAQGRKDPRGARRQQGGKQAGAAAQGRGGGGAGSYQPPPVPQQSQQGGSGRDRRAGGQQQQPPEATSENRVLLRRLLDIFQAPGK